MAPEVRSSLQMSSRRRPQGLAVGQIIQVYKPDRDWAFVSLTNTGCSDQYYDWWRRNEMAAGAFTTCVVQRSEIVNPRWAQRQWYTS